MRAGMDTLLAQVVQVFGEARPITPTSSPPTRKVEGMCLCATYT